jgi:hypothetical protein
MSRTKAGFANARRILKDPIEDRIQFSRRRTDDAQHIRCRSLLLQ